jgi:hypothetical protein
MQKEKGKQPKKHQNQQNYAKATKSLKRDWAST